MANKFLTGITIATSVGGEYTFPVADGTANQAIITDGNGNLSFGSAIASRAEDAERLVCEMINNSGSTIGAFLPVCCVGIHSDGTPEIAPARADNPLYMPAIGITQASVGNNNRTDILLYGKLEGVNTTAYQTGDTLYVAATGGWSTTRPTGSNLIQAVFKVGRIQQNNGSGGAFGAGKYEDLPNIANGSVWIGNSSSHPVATSLSTAIPTALGYTPADDSSVVKLTGAQTVGGLKTFSASIIANIGVLLKNGAVSALSGYTAIGGSSSNNGIDIALNTSGYTQSLLFQTGASYAYTFPAATGTVALTSNLSAYVPTSRTITINGTSYDLSADRSWTVTSMVYPSAGIAVSTGTAWGTSITDNSSNWNTAYGWGNHASAGYVPGARELTINGTTYDLTANRSWTIDATSVSTRTIQKFTSTANQTTFTITGGYAVGMVDVWVNGVKLDNATEFTASNGTTVVLAAGLTANQIVEVYKYGSQFIANNALRQKTLFTATAGQTTFTVAYSVGLVDVFYNGSKLDDSEYTATNGTSIVFGTACAVNDKVEVIAYSYNVNGFTGIGGSGTTNYIPKFTASGTIGNSLMYDNGSTLAIGTITDVGLSGESLLAAATGTNTIIARRTGNSNTNTSRILFQSYNASGLIQNTGIVESGLENSSTNGYIALRANNSEGLRITSSRNVLIGSTSYVGANPMLEVTTEATREGLSIKASTGGYSPFIIRDTDNSTMFYVRENGQVGTRLGNNFNLTGTYQTVVTIQSHSYGLLSVVSNMGGTYSIFAVWNEGGTTSTSLISGNNIQATGSGNNVQIRSGNGATYTDAKFSYLRFN